MTRPFRFGAVAFRASDGAAWAEVCRRIEGAGCTSLLVPDHFGDQLAPVPALAAAAAATTTLRLGLNVACNDYRHPVVHAKELATVDVLSGGRVDWGIGAGWLADEYARAGIAFDPPAIRVGRLEEAVTVMKGLFADTPCTFAGRHYQVRDLDGTPKPVQRPHPPLLVGGAGRRMLTLAARAGDIAGIAPSLTSRRLGAIPPAQTVERAIDEQVSWIRDAAGSRAGAVEHAMVAFPVAVTGDVAAVAERVAPGLGLSPDEVLRSPHAWVGPVDALCDELRRARERWGVSYWAVPVHALDALAPLIARLAGT